MGKCCNHPKVTTELMCMKDNVCMCDTCATCRHPSDYCKFRSSCIIWFMEHNTDTKSEDE